MRIAVISDIHGNIAALEAVLADIAARDADQIVNLGDLVSGALFPSETAVRLMPLELPTIAGNHERQLLTIDSDRKGLSDRYAAACLRPDQLTWIAGLPKTLRLTRDVLLVHGTPSSDTEYFLETVAEQGMRPAIGSEILTRASEADAAVILCGHTHLPRIRQLEDGRLIVNQVASACKPMMTIAHIRTSSRRARRMHATRSLSSNRVRGQRS